MKRLIAVIVLALALAGCGSGITSGQVVAKQYTPARDWIWMQPQYSTICEMVGKVEDCTTQFRGYLPIPMHDDQKWQLQLDNGNDKGWVDVPRETYDRVTIGSNYKVKED